MKILLRILFFSTVMCTLLANRSGAAQEDTFDRHWWAQAARPYQGTILRGITENTTSSAYVGAYLRQRFEELTGIKVLLEEVPWNTMYYRSIRDMASKSGKYDFVFIEQDIIYAYLAKHYLLGLKTLLKKNPQLAAPSFHWNQFTDYLNYFKDPATGEIFGLPMEAFLKIYVYRKDLFDDPVIQKAFTKQYGYPLAPAQDFIQFHDISKFFTHWAKENSKQLWGTTIQASLDHPGSFYEFFETILPAFGVTNWGINQQTMTASQAAGGTMNSAQAKQALRFWLGELTYSTPETLGSTWEETALSFASGRVAHQWLYAENLVWIATDPLRSKVVGNVGVAMVPMTPTVRAQLPHVSVGYYDGGAFGIPRSAQHIEATLLWLQFIGSPQVQTEWTLKTGRIVQKQTFLDPLIIKQDQALDGYYSLVQREGQLFSGAPPLACHASVRETVAPFLYRALRGQLAPDDALDQAATAVDHLLLQLGTISASSPAPNVQVRLP